MKMNNKWIPVTEELPPMETKVLVYYPTVSWSVKDHPQFLLGWWRSGLCWLYNCGCRDWEIEPTHWMPLEAPNGEE